MATLRTLASVFYISSLAASAQTDSLDSALSCNGPGASCSAAASMVQKGLSVSRHIYVQDVNSDPNPAVGGDGSDLKQDISEAYDAIPPRAFLDQLGAMFDATDADNDGYLTEAELNATNTSGLFIRTLTNDLPATKEGWLAIFDDMFYGRRPDVGFAELDVDGDGSLTHAEVDTYLDAQAFANSDHDGDGTLSYTEWRGADSTEQAQAKADQVLRDIEEAAAHGDSDLDLLSTSDGVREGHRANTTYDPQRGGSVSLCMENTYYHFGRCLKHCPHNKPHLSDLWCSSSCGEHCSATSNWNCGCAGNKCHDTFFGEYCGWAVWSEHRHNVEIGAGSIPELCSLGGDRGPPAVSQKSSADFTMAFMGDPQFGFTPGHGETFAHHHHLKGTNEETMRAIRSVTNSANNFQGLVMTGDLSNDGGKTEFEELQQVWCDGYNLDDDSHRWNKNIWPSLGNHDYQNNLYYKDGSGKSYGEGEATWTFYGRQGAAQHMMGWMRSLVGGCGSKKMISNFDKGKVDHYQKSSMGYAWSVGNQRFIVLHNYPTYEGKECQIKNKADNGGNCNSHMITFLDSALGFLERDLNYACASGMMANLIFHDWGDAFCRSGVRDGDCNAFKGKIENTCVLAIFVGHHHDRVGHFNNRVVGVQNKWNNDIPIYWTGAPTSQDKLWLMATYTSDGVTVQPYDSTSTTGSAASAQKATCPGAYNTIPQNLDGTGKQWQKVANIEQCAETCNARSGCTAFEYSTRSEKGQCGTYTGGAGGASNIRGNENRGSASDWKSCVKANYVEQKSGWCLPWGNDGELCKANSGHENSPACAKCVGYCKKNGYQKLGKNGYDDAEAQRYCSLDTACLGYTKSHNSPGYYKLKFKIAGIQTSSRYECWKKV